LLRSAIDAIEKMTPGYRVRKRDALKMAGRDEWRKMIEWLEKTRDKGFLTPHDVTTGSQIAMICTGGDVDAGTLMTEDEICALERKAFLTLANTAETKARIQHMLSFGTPLRN
jgi:3-hydroxyacyl-CoA dehydrogenase